jgi:hypothetical protein
MKIRKIFNLLLLAMLMSAALATSTNAQDPAKEALNNLLHGTYASSASRSCIFAGIVLGTFFDENLAIQPVGSDSLAQWNAFSTKVTYNGDGTGSEVGGATFLQNTGAGSGPVNCDLTYIVNIDQSFEVTKQCEINIGDVPFSFELVENGHIQRGGGVLITTMAEPRISTGVSPGFPEGFLDAICVQSATQIKLSGQ